ncbi:MAG: hypothetical protein KKB31_05900 [Nanoarchaeota archaeon]|nr:hypothetical protein [Nanoarchaeota archaeon]
MVTTINLQFPSTFEFPYTIFDVLREKEKSPIIKTSDDIQILKEIDFILYAKPISKKKAFAPRQKYILYLRPEDAPIDDDFLKLNKLPANHLFEIDTANFKIRVMGPFVQEETWWDY